MNLLVVTGLALRLAANPCPAAPQANSAPSLEDRLLGVVLLRDRPGAERLLKDGASPDARNRENNRTALFFAAELGDAAMVELLLRFGARIDVKDTLHGETPVGAASRTGHADVVRLLLAKDASSAESVAWNGIYQRNLTVLDAALAGGGIPAEALSFLLDEADRSGPQEIADRLRRAGAVLPRPITLRETDLAPCVGSYRSEDGAKSLAISLAKEGLQLASGETSFGIVPLDPTYFVREGHRFPTLRFEIRDGVAAVLTLRDADDWTRLIRVGQ
jgi:hypothetical protein